MAVALASNSTAESFSVMIAGEAGGGVGTEGAELRYVEEKKSFAFQMFE